MTAEKIQMLLLKRKMKTTDLAKMLGCTPTNIYKKYKRDNFSEEEVKKIAELLNCDYEVTFTLKDTGEKI